MKGIRLTMNKLTFFQLLCYLILTSILSANCYRIKKLTVEVNRFKIHRHIQPKPKARSIQKLRERYNYNVLEV